MVNFKRLLCIVLMMVLVCFSFTGCTTAEHSADIDINENLRIVRSYDAHNRLINIIIINLDTGVTIVTDYFWSEDNGYVLVTGSYTKTITTNGDIVLDETVGDCI